jgi:uncharacterized protein (DUF2147 family)
MIMRKKKVFALLFLALGLLSYAQERNDIIGYWKSCDIDDNMVVRVQLDDNEMPEAYLVGFQKENGEWETGKPKKGIKVMYGLSETGILKWGKGKIYDPLVDRTYRGVIKLQSKDTIKATGYWAFLWDDILYNRIKLDKKDEPNR